MKENLLKTSYQEQSQAPKALMFKERESKLLPSVGDYIMYQGSLVEVLKINYIKRMMVVVYEKKKLLLELRAGYRIYVRG